VQPLPPVSVPELPQFAELVSISETTASTGHTRKDTTGEREADNRARSPILYAAIAAAFGAVVFTYLKYPTPALLSGIAGGVFFYGWHLAGQPALLNKALLVGVVAGVIAIGIYIGHETAERRARKAAGSLSQTNS
jgi:hypothetical protein